MNRILILCEGQTEETFVKRILYPHLLSFGKVAVPTVLTTKKVKAGHEFKGGITSYTHIRREVQHLLRDMDAICVTTILDYYGLPNNFPGKDTLPRGTPYERVNYLEQKFLVDIGAPRFLPYLMLHEFEALLFVDLEIVIGTLASPIAPQQFGDLGHFSSPEEINEGRQTHPAARLQHHLPGYRKALHGPLSVERIGLPRIREQCRHFDEWLNKLES